MRPHIDLQQVYVQQPLKWIQTSKQLLLCSGICFSLAFVSVLWRWDFSIAGVAHHVLSPDGDTLIGSDHSYVASSSVSQQKHQIRWAFSVLWSIIVTLSFGLGAMFFVLMQHLSRAGWSVVVRRIAEQVMRTIPVMFLLLWGWTLLGGLHSVYHWVHPDDPILLKKVAYLNVTFFLVRMLFYFVTWTMLSRFFFRRSIAQDIHMHPIHTILMQRFSGPWTFAYTLTITFFAFDLIMSIDPHWYSTIFGIYYFSGSMVSFLSLLGLLIIFFHAGGYLRGVVTVEHLHDIGKLLFGFNAFWAYVAYSQYGIIWYGNIPEETLWYLERMDDPFWLGVSRVLVGGHLIIPLFVFISKHAKRNVVVSGGVYVLLIVMHMLDLYYLIMPRSVHIAGGGHHWFAPQWIDVLFLIATLTMFAGLLVRFFATNPLVPIGDPRLRESMEFHNG